MENFWIIVTAIAGVCVGSFLNVLIHRLPLKQPVGLDRSRCPNCHETLKWYHNIPVLSFIALRARCAFCSQPISFRYPLVELLNSAGWFLLAWHFGISWMLLVYAAFYSAMIVIFFIDLDHQIIPDRITLPGIVVGLAVSFLPGGIGILSAGIGLLVGGGALYLIALLGDWLFKKESMGGGDIKMAAMMGAFLGWQKVVFIFMGAATIGLIVSLVAMGFSGDVRRTRVIPFGPFLAMAAVAAVVWGDQLIGWYLVSVIGLPPH